VPILNDSFEDEVRQAVDLVAELSKDVARVLCALCDFSKPASAADLVNRAYPGIPDEVRLALADGEANRLDNFCRKSGVLQNIEGKYHVTSVFRYALKIALKLA
jgi:hypothetical protein